MARLKGLMFLLYLIFGLYFINYSLNLITLPGFFSSIDQWIILVGGLLIILGGINQMGLNKFAP
ncbi:MAG: hypothetical protein KGH55_00255 [Nanoarchaeota archaeon]|nr:hypothetical protein [Nanoarchaeota archaeon]